MKKKVLKKLVTLRSDYKKNAGDGFLYFFCPILFLDEKTELCEAHIANKAFNNTARSWTVQRKDVDGFFGRIFESDFTKISYKLEELSPDQIITDTKLGKKYKPILYNNGVPVEHFYPSGIVPDHFSTINLIDKEKQLKLGLKINHIKITDEIEIEVNLDLRVSSLVSLLKAGYLTLFEMLGYSYVLSPSGYFIGSNILGSFYNTNKNVASKNEILNSAKNYFEYYVHMVRPIDSFPAGLKGTIKDNKVYLLEKEGVFFGCIVFIKISSSIHAVLMPMFDSLIGKYFFSNFIKQRLTNFSIKLGIYTKNAWKIFNMPQEFNWYGNGASLLD